MAPIVIGHRGASGYRPEHTLASYQLAIDLGADFIEPDIVPTRDGQLVARHENEISGTTDIAQHPEFAARRTTKHIDGAEVTGWFTEDLTLAELKTLRARERLPELRPGNTVFDGRFEVPTLAEILALAARASHERGRAIGVYPETKHPSYFKQLGLALEPPLVEALHAHGYRDRSAPVFIQSFETQNLRELRTLTQLPLVQLIEAHGAPADAGPSLTYAALITPEGLASIAQYADALGVHKDLIVPRGEDGALLAPTSLLHAAHAAGLRVHAWTFRAENAFLPRDFRVARAGTEPVRGARGDLHAELRLFYGLGVDGVFADHPDVAVATRT